MFLLLIVFALVSGAYFQLALGAVAPAGHLQYAAGAFNFTLCLVVWYMFWVEILDSVDFPITLPVGDLSTFVIGKSQKPQKGCRCQCQVQDGQEQ
ncbi:hypothetical protein BJX68DRAFT_266160 [Aspergillus pseudodeflectus]|uniref:Uncharacterized protein n=1 Tax=Aspergillus pseudodeflectus TaxID=176178 RepID=A0ABR4KG53_9EURO